MYIHINDIKPGMILKAVSANGTRTRKVYKVKHGPFPDIWSIPVRWLGDEWVEECAMVGNSPKRISHLIEIVGGKVVETKISIMV